MLLLLVCPLVPACLVCAPDPHPPAQKVLRDKLTEILPKVFGSRIRVTCEEKKFSVIELTIPANRQSLSKIVDALCGKKPNLLTASSEDKANYKCCKAYVEARRQEFTCACGKETCHDYYDQRSQCANAIFPGSSTWTLPDECNQ